MNLDEHNYLPPSRTSVRRIIKECVYILLGFISLYLLMYYLVMINYTMLGKMRTEQYGERLSKAILNYAISHDKVLPTGLTDLAKLSTQLNSISSASSNIGANDIVSGEVKLNANIAGIQIRNLEPKTELFTITNTYLFNNFKIVHYVDGTTSSSELP